MGALQLTMTSSFPSSSVVMGIEIVPVLTIFSWIVGIGVMPTMKLLLLALYGNGINNACNDLLFLGYENGNDACDC
jgi:hypothetical protein